MQCNKRANFFSLNLFVFPPRTCFLFASAPNSVNTSRDSQRVCVSVCVFVTNAVRVYRYVCEKQGVHANVCALVCYFDFFLVSEI